jgi:hypothetical protein
MSDPPDALSQPINIFNFGSYLGQVLAIVQDIAQSVAAIIFTQNEATVTENLLATNQVALQNQVTLLTQQVAALAATVGNTVNLLLVTIEGLGNVATAPLQQEEITLLEEIAQNVAPTRPVELGLDFTNVTSTKQSAPTGAGP